MTKLEVLSVANAILKASNYKGEFEIISDVDQETVNNLDLYYLGGVPDAGHGIGVYYTMEVNPTNFVKFENKYYILF